MQTFLPYPDFVESASVLDVKRLGNQRCEALVLARGGWKNHPASKMWRGHERSLCEYGFVVCKTWTSLGYVDRIADEFVRLSRQFPDSGPPPWLGDERFHASHRSNLLRKCPSHYRMFFPHDPDDLPYVWPE